ncbi:hypothetical protein [Halosimplex carlsbadense]|nr:hypothetical protein [Halosimplex carlsbadense]
MERIEAMVPPPLNDGIEEYRENQGFENKSQAIRALLRKGLEQ